jgi:hypothetical protein
MVRTLALLACCVVSGGTARAQDGAPASGGATPGGGQAAPADPKPAPDEGGPEGIGRRIFEALNRHRAASQIPAAQWSARAYIALQDHLDLIVKRGYRGGPPRDKKYPKLSDRTRERHGWSLSLLDNYSNGRKGGMDPDSIIKILQTNPDIRSLLRKDLNAGAAAATNVPGTDDYCIVVGLMRAPAKDVKDLPRIEAAEKEWGEADAKKRQSIVKGLAAMNEGDTLLLLTRALADPDAGVREDAAKAVAKLGDCWPVPTLLARLEAESEAPVKDEIQKALEAISGRSKKEYEGLAKWKVWWSVEQEIFVKRK